MTSAPDNASIVSAMLRDHDYDRWLSVLFAPQAARAHLTALYAFNHETARIRDIVSEPQLGEIRLQWWREVIDGGRAGEAALNPVSQQLIEAMRLFDPPAASMAGLIEARRFDLYNDPMPDMNTLEGYCGETCSILYRLAAHIISRETIEQCDASLLADACGHAGVADQMSALLLALPQHAARGQCYLPRDVLERHGALPQAAAAGLVTKPLLAAIDEMRQHARSHLEKSRKAIGALPIVLKPAFAQLALAPLRLKALEKNAHAPFDPAPQIARWRRQWAMWRF